MSKFRTPLLLSALLAFLVSVAPTALLAGDREDAYLRAPVKETPPPEMVANDDLVRPHLPGKTAPTDPRDGRTGFENAGGEPATPEVMAKVDEAIRRKIGAENGGDDSVVREQLYYESTYMDIGANGDIFVGCAMNPSAPDGEYIEVYRSQDGGTTFDYWGGLNSPNPNYERLYGLDVVNGNFDYIFITYMWWNSARGGFDMRVSYADPSATSATWNTRTVMNTAGVSFLGPNITTDVTQFGAFYLYAVCAGLDSNGDDVWYSRSTDYGNSWSAPYRIRSLTSSSRLMYTRPVIAYGAGGMLHVGYTYTERLQSTFDDAVRYVNATNYGASAANWNTTTWALTPTNDGINQYVVKVATPGVGDTVAIFASQWASSGISRVYANYTAGSAWSTLDYHDLPVYGWLDWTWDAASDEFLLAGAASDDYLSAFSAPTSDLSSWTQRGQLSDREQDSFTLPSIRQDPTRGNRLAIAWNGYLASGGSWALFDAEWRADLGQPNYETGFPLAIPNDAPGSALQRTAPLVANIDNDAFDEIVFASTDGHVYVVSHDGSIQIGWPQDIGDITHDSPVAVGDINGDGTAEIVAGNTEGWIYAWNGEGTIQPGFPVNLGTGAQAYLAIGAVGPPYHRWIVVASGTKVARINYRGEVEFKSGFLNGVYTTAPAIGDVDGDGDSEIVVNYWPNSPVDFSGVHIYQGDFVGGTQNRSFAGAPSGGVTLGDIDRDGDLEICHPTYNGTVNVMHHDFTDVAGFPYTNPGSTSFSSVSMDQMLGTGNPELIFSSTDGYVHVVYSNGVSQSNFPALTGTSWILFSQPIVTSVLGFNPWVVVASRDDNAWAFRNVGATQPEGWPKNINDKVEASAAAGDIDKDGRNEIVFLGHAALHVIDVGTASEQSGPESWRMAGHDPARTSCMDCTEDISTAVGEGLPTRVGFRLASVNPAPGPVSFAATLPGPGIVELGIFDLRGRRVRLVSRKEVDAGVHTLHFDGRDNQGAALARGAYFARLNVQGKGFSEKAIRKFLLTN